MRLIFKGGHKGSANKKHKYKVRYRDPETGKWVYDKDPNAIKRSDKFVARLIMPDGSKKPIYPDAHEVDENGKIVGGHSSIREIINRELFGDYGFDKDKKFWQREGALQSYRTRVKEYVDADGRKRMKVIVETVPKGTGFVAFEFRDKSVEGAYSKGLPQKILKHRVSMRGIDEATGEPTSEYQEAAPRPQHGEKYALLLKKRGIDPSVGEPAPEGTAAQPVAHGDKVINVREQPPSTARAIGEPLDSHEDPIALAQAFLDLFLHGPKPSQAKTEAGQARARAKVKGYYGAAAGHRNLTAFPKWAVAKFKSAAELQYELGRDRRPVTTLITLGLWNNHNKEAVAQLNKEWESTVRRHAYDYVQKFKLDDQYRQLGVADLAAGLGESDKGSQRVKYVNERMRELKQVGFNALNEGAKDYRSNDEPHGPDARFDEWVNTKIMNAIRDHATAYAEELGANRADLDALDQPGSGDMGGSAVLTPEDHHVLHVLKPIARRIIEDALADLPQAVSRTFRSRLWMDDPYVTGATDKPEESEENRYFAASKVDKKGGAQQWWGRPWTRDKKTNPTGVASISDKLANARVDNTMDAKKLGDLSPELQRYYMQKWYEQARTHLQSKLSPGGRDTTDGSTVKQWLTTEAKLAHVNRREVTHSQTAKIIKMPELHGRSNAYGSLSAHGAEHVRHEDIGTRAEAAFFREPSNLALGIKLGIVRHRVDETGVEHHDDPFRSEAATGIRGQLRGQNIQRVLDRAKKYHKVIGELASMPDKLLRNAHTEHNVAVDRAHEVGHWTPSGGWHEGPNGVEAMHRYASAAVKAQRAGDVKGHKAAMSHFAEVAGVVRGVKKMQPVADAYAAAVGAGKMLDADDLSNAKVEAHAAHDELQAMKHVMDYEMERRHFTKSLTDGFNFIQALDAYDFALARLYQVLA